MGSDPQSMLMDAERRKRKNFDFDRRTVSPDTPQGILIKRYNDEVFKLRECRKQADLFEQVVINQEESCEQWLEAIKHFERTPE
jgi:hypothetical protein